MNARDLISVIGEAQDTYVKAAMETRERTARPARLSWKRAVLLAAVLALSMLLVGCTLAYVLRLQELKIADEAVTQRFNEEGRIIEPTQVRRDVISLNSYSGSALQLATREWYAFTQTYDPDDAIRRLAQVEGLPEDYVSIYDCYTQEKVDMVDALAEKYALKLLRRQTLVQRYQNEIFFDALGIGPLCRADAPADIVYGSGYFYENGNFRLTVDFTLHEGWQEQIWTTVLYSHKDCFEPMYSTVDIDAFDQWEYAASDGTRLLLARKGTQAYIFADKGEAMLTVLLNLAPVSSSPFADSQEPGREVIQQAAELFDYTIQPQPIADFAPIDAALEAAEQAWLESHQVQPEEFSSFESYLLAQFWIDDLYYVNLDLEGDGQQELLLANQDGAIQEILWMKEGKVEAHSLDNVRLCEGNVFAGLGLSEEYSFEAYSYYRMPYGEYEDLGTIECQNGVYRRYGDGIPEEEITAEEFEAIRSQYPYEEVDWTPALEYVTDSGGTVGDILDAQAIVLSQEGQREVFARTAAGDRSVYKRKFYTFLDINGDGQEELILGADEESFNMIYLMRRSRAQCMYEGTSWLCRGNVIAQQSQFQDYDRGWAQQYTYQSLSGTEFTTLDTLYYWQGTDSWTTSRTGGEISPEDAAAIQAKYEAVDLGMKPLGELMDAYGIP